MPLPAVYTEVTLATFMDQELGEVADVLGWALAAGPTVGSYAEMVNDVLVLLGVIDLSTVAVSEARAAARVVAWGQAVKALAARIDLATGGGTSITRSQYQIQAKVALAQAEMEARALGLDPMYVATIDRLDHVNDPYIYVPDESRV
jgi:hypothetical protein